jgi:hypothetical protein
MKKEVVLGIVRHVLTFVGGMLITKGLIDESTAQELVGSFVTTIGLIWSVIQKNNNAK